VPRHLHRDALRDARADEIADGGSPKVEEIKALKPRAIIVSGDGAAARLRANPAWQSVEAVAAGRVYEWPRLPYSWGSRPPSVNRLPGLVWLAYKASDRAFDAAFYAEIRGLFRDCYHLELTEPQMRKVLGSE
jgi:iron complex transport system substrate-binding protein